MVMGTILPEHTAMAITNALSPIVTIRTVSLITPLFFTGKVL